MNFLINFPVTGANTHNLKEERFKLAQFQGVQSMLDWVQGGNIRMEGGNSKYGNQEVKHGNNSIEEQAGDRR